MNNEIFQQALSVQSSDFIAYSTSTWAITVSKLFQVFLPQIIYLLTIFLISRQSLIHVANRLISIVGAKSISKSKSKNIINSLLKLQGFFLWKFACDFGFFLIVTQYGSPLRALNIPSLIVYTVVQIFLYFYIGQYLILRRLWVGKSKLVKGPASLKIGRRERFISRLFYEELGNNTNQATPIIILTKIIIDYVSIVFSWSAYTIAFFLFTHNHFDLSPFLEFPHISYASFYFSAYLGYAFGLTFFDILLRYMYNQMQPSMDRISGTLNSIILRKLLASLSLVIIFPVLLGITLNFWFSVGEFPQLQALSVDAWRRNTNLSQGFKANNNANGIDPSAYQDKCNLKCIENRISDFYQSQ